MKIKPLYFVTATIVQMIGVMFVMTACDQKSESVTEFDPNVLAKEWIGAWNSHVVDSILTFYTEDALFEDVPDVENGWGVLMRGHQMIRESLIELFEEMPDLRLEVVSAFGTGDHLVIEWIMTGTQYKSFTGKFSIRAVSIFQLQGKKIVSEKDYYDTYLLLSQLGIISGMDVE